MTSGQIQTVTGLIKPSQAGITLTHEHLSIDFNVSYIPAKNEEKEKEVADFTLANSGWIRQNPYSHKSNLMMDPKEDFDTIVQEMKFFKQNGGATVVDNTTLGIARNVNFLKKLSEDSGVNIVAGAGYYVDAAHPGDVAARSEEDIAQQIIAELTQGCDGTDIKAGVIGEIGCSWPLTVSERKILRATAAAQTATGCPVIIHPGRNDMAPFEVVRVLQEAGGDIGKTVMSHIDRTIFNNEQLLEFAALGSYCEWDLFGLEVSHYMVNPKEDMPSDAQRIKAIRCLLDAGYGEKVVIAHDIHTKHRLMKYGGHGFSHILMNVVPKMLARGFTQPEIDAILVDNPRKWLAYK